MRGPLLQIPLLVVSMLMILHGLFGPIAGAEESGDHPELAALPRSAGAGATVRGEFLLPGLSVHAGAAIGATALPAAIQLAARAAEQMAFGRSSSF